MRQAPAVQTAVDESVLCMKRSHTISPDFSNQGTHLRICPAQRENSRAFFEDGSLRLTKTSSGGSHAAKEIARSWAADYGQAGQVTNSTSRLYRIISHAKETLPSRWLASTL